MPLRAFIAALVLAVAHGTAAAADVIGYSEAFDTLFRVDLSTHTAQELGPAGSLNGTRIADLEGLSYSPGGTLFAVSDGLKILLRINPQTGHATVVGPLNLGNEALTAHLDLGMTFTCDGRLWLSAAADGNFWQVDPASGATTLVGNLGVKVTGLTSSGQDLYGTGSQGNNNLYRIDPATAKSTLVGAYGIGTYVTTVSPAFDASGKLWSILSYVPPQQGTTEIPPWSDLASINAATGSLINTGNITGPSDLQTEFYGELRGLALMPPVCGSAGGPGAATDATPSLSPWGLLALAASMSLLAGTRLRRRRPT